MSIQDASRRQLTASLPERSTWLSANAGSGKTRVLTDRVARLLLEGVEPQHILCLTYTKAAASEMQNRLFQRLGAWAMLDDAELRSALSELGVTNTAVSLDDARTLFARAIEAPGGLKIQTIHSFCAALLRRFPLEAGVTPQFTEIEDRAADLLRAEIVDEMASGATRNLVTELAQHYSGEDFLGLTREIIKHKAAFSEGLDGGAARALFGVDTDLTRTEIEEEVFFEGDLNVLQALVPILLASGTNDERLGRTLQSIHHLSLDVLPILETVLLTGPSAKQPFSAKIGSVPTTAIREANADLMPQFEALMLRVETARERRLALKAAETTIALHTFAQDFVARYETAKTLRGLLDFDDLILKTRSLLTNPSVAAWVLYRIDGGIDHILVDEAQDTSPMQWEVICKLAEEFASGHGAQGQDHRTIFVVGDKKQSIYSFQGADPEEFDRMQTHFDGQLSHSGQRLQKLTLEYSFRSSPAILKLVDAIFEGKMDSKHRAFKSDLPGRVDLWPLVERTSQTDDRKWYDPVDQRSPEHQDAILSQHIARTIRNLIDEKVLVPSGDGAGQPARARDFLILVQKRSGIFPEIIRACKEADLPIAGADRLKVGAELAVRDLGALLSFLATPEDSLALATALRSPLFGLDEAELFDLAHYRKTEHLWPALRERKTEYPKTVDVLQDLRDQVDFLRPYDLIERMLTRHSGRARIVARLGTEAEDGINALLLQALSYERNAVPSLTGFLAWMEIDDLEIKRQIDSASNQIRVMTVHGAKGLEAPIVILPDCAARKNDVRDEILLVDDRAVLKAKSDLQPIPMRRRMDEMKSAQMSERMRLLYVALTRAEKWLIVAGAGDHSKDNTSWHQIIKKGLEATQAKTLQTPVGEGKRLELGDWSGLKAKRATHTDDPPMKLENHFGLKIGTAPQRARSLSPSDLGGEKTLPGEGLETELALAYGSYVHLLLEKLSLSPQEDWPAVFATADAQPLLTPDMIAQGRAEALNVLRAPSLQSVFSVGTLAEVPITADLEGNRIHGIIDRLIVTPERILAVDFKTNRIVPESSETCPEGLLRQLGAYAAALGQVYSDRAIETAILWTRPAELMVFSHDMVIAALERCQYLDADEADT
ncbi:MAG: double-strand break repair helicase AddA [Paracoccaceae bacterium]